MPETTRPKAGGFFLNKPVRFKWERSRENEVPYPFLLAGGTSLKGWPVRRLPTAHLIDGEGRIVRSWFGYKDPHELEESVQAQLRGEPPEA